MIDIMHRVVIETSPARLYEALTTSEGLSAWWTRAEAQAEVGGEARFSFGPTGDFKVVMQITELDENALVIWKCIQGPWQNTESFIFRIEEDDRGTALEFSNTGWPNADDFYMHCNCKWGLFLGLSLKSYLETGKGYPSPNEPQI